MTTKRRPGLWNDFSFSTAISILPLLFWVAVLCKWLFGFHVIQWVADLITDVLGAPAIRFLGGMEIDDPTILSIASAVTAGLLSLVLSRIWDHKMLLMRGIVMRATVRRIIWMGDRATLSFEYEYDRQNFSDSATVAYGIGNYASCTGLVYLLIDPRHPKRFMVLRPEQAIGEDKDQAASLSPAQPANRLL